MSPNLCVSLQLKSWSVEMPNDVEFFSNDSQLVSNGSSSLELAVESGRNYYAMFYSLLILAIVFGNVLVCLAVLRERSLQTTTNYLVVSLAVADLLVATLVMPWAVYLEVSQGKRWGKVRNTSK